MLGPLQAYAQETRDMPAPDPSDPRSEDERMIAGDWYRYRLAPALAEATTSTQATCRQITALYDTDLLGLGGGLVTIGKHVLIGPSVRIYTSQHALDVDDRRAGWERVEPVTIEDDVWLGGNVVILPGEKIGARSVVGAGSVVVKDVPPDVVVVGNPARVVRTLA